jgi:hypothetical protein
MDPLGKHLVSTPSPKKKRRRESGGWGMERMDVKKEKGESSS